MEWLRAHPYSAALGAAGILIVIGIFVVKGNSSVAPAQSGTNAWTGVNAPVLSTSSYVPPSSDQNSESIFAQAQNSAPYTYIPPFSSANTDTTSDTGQSGGFDFNAFIAELSQGSAPNASTSAGTDTSATANAYAFIPNGLVSTTTSYNKRTALQKTLYDYGNGIGSYIQSFETQYPNEAQVLKNQVEDRTDAGKNASVKALGHGLANIGDNLLQMGDVPSQMAAAHEALAESYKDIGAKLALVPDAQSNADFIAAIQTYDAAADTFTKNYVAMANLFGAYGVTFASDDPGSVFTFTQTTL